jgi:hypothetical protein
MPRAYSADMRVGEKRSPLEEHGEFLLALIDDQSLDEVVCAMRKHKVPGSRTAVWWFFQRYKITFKKTRRAAEQERTDVARARRRWTRDQGMFDSARLVFVDETSANTRWCGCTAPRGHTLPQHSAELCVTAKWSVRLPTWFRSGKTRNEHNTSGLPRRIQPVSATPSNLAG